MHSTHPRAAVPSGSLALTAMACGFLAVTMAGCGQRPPAARQEAAQAGRRAQTPPPTAGHIVLLPDSALVAEPGSIEAQLADFLASKAPAPRTFRFSGREFEPWESTPTPRTLRTMYALVQVLRAYPHAAVTLTGYTDRDGTDAQNVALATARVRRLAALLTQGGVDPRRITLVGKGAADFVADNATEQGRARNRRIELTVTGK